MKRRDLLKSLGLVLGSSLPTIVTASTRSSGFDGRTEWEKCRDDICYFAEKYFLPQIQPVEPSQSAKLYPIQKEILRAMVSKERVVVRGSRISGKTTLSSIYVFWRTHFFRNVQILYVGINSHLNNQIRRQLLFIRERLTDLIDPSGHLYRNCVVTVTDQMWYRDSNIYWRTPTDNFPSAFEIDEIITDEIAYATQHPRFLHRNHERTTVLDAFSFLDQPKHYMKKIVHISTTNGRSTTNGWDGIFFRKWFDRRYTRFTMRWDDVFDRDEKWAKAHKALWNCPRVWECEYECSFLLNS